MKFFVDTANLNEIESINELGVVEGVTTNPSLIAKEEKNFMEIIDEITKTIDGPISVEVISLKSEEMIEEAKKFAKLHKNIVIKIPICYEGLKAIKKLNSIGIKTNATLIFSSSQALLAARAGATYVSLFLGRLDDIGVNSIKILKEIVIIFNTHCIDSKIIAASLRHPMHVIKSAKAGAHIATVPYKILLDMLTHPLTKNGIEQFLKDWEGTTT
ncbi:MAG: fructose-6-phosphate aldolase [Clostridiales bacterium]|jgi:transaldolase|nr:fructose-6-phosphate aldolase [Clostridiales bacterium]